VSEVLDFCRRFVGFVEREGVASGEELVELQWITLRLCASAASPTNGASTSEEAEIPIAEEPRTRAEIAARFPRFGFYWSALDRLAVAGTFMAVGDSIDDIESVYTNARKALECFEVDGEEEAEANFRVLFRVRTGARAHALAAYLHDMRTRWPS
jgi:hypothetical protein